METQEVSALVFNELKQVNNNDEWFDWGRDMFLYYINYFIGARNPQWASINNGIFICVNWVALHRGLGAHISFVRSVNLDEWNERQLKCMSVGGNAKLKEFFEIYDLDTETIDYKYNTKVGDYYRKKVNIICS